MIQLLQTVTFKFGEVFGAIVRVDLNEVKASESYTRFERGTLSSKTSKTNVIKIAEYCKSIINGALLEYKNMFKLFLFIYLTQTNDSI